MIKLVRAGFLPLVDAAILIAAKEQGFAEIEGLDLTLHKETSWATVRDRLSVGQLDVAHMLAPLPIAQNLGLMALQTKLVVPFALGLGGNAITVSNDVKNGMDQSGFVLGDPASLAGRALKKYIVARNKKRLSKLKFGVVHAFSSHAYELRYWLAASGINPDHELSIIVVPPSLLPDALHAGEIDGFCVGEPWNSVAVRRASGCIITTKSQIWSSSPEKVLATRKQWAETQAETLQTLLRALHQSARWCGLAENRGRLAEILAAPNYLNVDPSVIQESLEGHLPGIVSQPDFIMFYERAANFPWQSHALWFFSQMMRWKDVIGSSEAAEIARMTYRPDIYRAALGPLGAVLPGASSKIEGGLIQTVSVPAVNGALELGPDGFFDGLAFDPDKIREYLRLLP